MKLYLKLSLILILFNGNGCSNKQPSSKNGCGILKFKPVYYDKGCHGNHCAYYHTLMLENFEDTCFSMRGNYDFIRLADEYLDTVKTDTPVGGITFVKRFNFNPHYDGRDTEPLHEHTILDIGYSEDSWGSKVPEIDMVGYWIDGERKGLDYLQVKIRKQGMSVYHSQKRK